MLTAVAHQIIERVIQVSNADDAIELSELMEDSEEEQEKEDELILFQNIESSDFEMIREALFGTTPNAISLLDFFYKIPVPPPELV